MRTRTSYRFGPEPVGLGIAFMIGFIATILVANWLVTNYGIVGVGFGLQAPAAVFAVGIAFTFRDLLQRTLGIYYVLAAIVVGTLLSIIISPQFAFASGLAFAVSELMDLLVYTPLEKRTFLGAVLASNVVGIVVDSIVFLLAAFGTLEFLAGQIVGKAWMTVLALLVLIPARRFVPAREPAFADAGE